MGQFFLFVVVALIVAAIVFGVTVMVSGSDSALTPVEPDGRALPLPSDRPLGEEDIMRTKFDTAVRGYRMAQVDQALQRAAYDIGYKGELIGVLEAEVLALREGRIADADVLRRAREAAVAPPLPPISEDPIALVADLPPGPPPPGHPPGPPPGSPPLGSLPGSPLPGSLPPGSLPPGSPLPGSLPPGSPLPGSPLPGSPPPDRGAAQDKNSAAVKGR